MLATDEDALICDFAETYHLYDWRQIPLRTAAILACGLGDESRIKMKLAGMKIPLRTLMLAQILDMQNLIWWSKTEDGQNNRNRPASIIQALMGGQDERRDSIMSFSSGEEFEAMFNKISKGG